MALETDMRKCVVHRRYLPSTKGFCSNAPIFITARHCPDLDGLLSPALVVTYSDSSEKGRVGSTASFYCPDDLVLKGPRMIECVNGTSSGAGAAIHVYMPLPLA